MKTRNIATFIFLVIFATSAFGADKKVKAPDASDWEKSIESIMDQPVNPESVVPPKSGPAQNQFEVVMNGDNVSIIMNDPKLVRSGVGNEGFIPTTVSFTANGKNPFCTVSVQGDRTTACVIPNPAKQLGVTTVLNFWGFGKDANGTKGFTMLNPNDPAVSAVTKDGKPDMGTLVVSIVFHSDGTWEFGKKYGNRETLKTGPHPEIAKK